MKLRVGLIGLGEEWNSTHRPALKSLSEKLQVCAICCEVADRSKLVADEFGAIPIDGFRAMMERADIDAVLVLAPDWVGPLPIIAACEAGKAVYTAAALDISPDQAKEIRRRVEASGVAFMAEFPRRHAPATIRLKELIATRLGPPRLLFCHQRMAVESQANKLRRGENCPLTWKYLTELVDWCRYLVDRDPDTVNSTLHEQHDENADLYYQAVSLEFPKSERQPYRPLAQLSIGHYMPAKWKDALSFRRPASIQVCCENGMAFIDLPSNLVWFDDAGQHTESLESERPLGEQMLDHFHRAVTSFIRKTTSLEDAYRSQRIVMSAHESARIGQRIEINYD